MPQGFLLPLLESAGSVEDESLQELWAALLANSATNPTHRNVLLVQVLKGFSPIDAANYKSWFRQAMRESLSRAPDFQVPYTDEDFESAIRLEVLGVIQITHLSKNTASQKGRVLGSFRKFASTLWEAVEGPVVWERDEQTRKEMLAKGVQFDDL